MQNNLLRIGLLPLVAAVLAACGDSGSNDVSSCTETGAYPCQTGQTEPLYAFQWAQNYAESYFKDFPEAFGGGVDLNVEPVHRQGIKGQGVNVLVLDTGTDFKNEDLEPNADWNMAWNFVTQTNDPYPALAFDPDADAHGTVVAGIIAAAQNGKGVMGIAPHASLGAANFLSGPKSVSQTYLVEAYGGAEWSKNAHVINASYAADVGANTYDSPENDSGSYGNTIIYRGLKNMRDGKGVAFVKAASNSYDSTLCGIDSDVRGLYNCINPSNDLHTLESNIIVVAALNAQGRASSYSSAGSVVWVTGMGGEYGNSGTYGEGAGSRRVKDGPTIYSTDLRGCIEGYSNTFAETPFQRGQSERDGTPDNPNCDYTYMNGTSAATPTISGVVTLMLSANPNLTWRDVRDILRKSARKIDANYTQRGPESSPFKYGALVDLTTNEPTSQLGSASDIVDGATKFPLDLGWQTNAVGLHYSNRYGFGVPDAEKAVALAVEYKNRPELSRTGDVKIPDFKAVAYWHLNTPLDPEELAEAGDIQLKDDVPFLYERVTSLGTFNWPAQTVDQLQVRLSGENVCLGSIGIAAKSPSGTMSLLKLPNDHFKAGVNDGNGGAAWDEFGDYALTSYTFHGEDAAGNWELFLIASNPDIQIEVGDIVDGAIVLRPSVPCTAKDADGNDKDYAFGVEARIIAQ